MCAARRAPPFRRTSRPPFVFGFLFLFRAFFATIPVRLAPADGVGEASRRRAWRAARRSIACAIPPRSGCGAASESSEFAIFSFHRQQY
jgi:hypothetical protein